MITTSCVPTSKSFIHVIVFNYDIVTQMAQNTIYGNLVTRVNINSSIDTYCFLHNTKQEWTYYLRVSMNGYL